MNRRIFWGVAIALTILAPVFSYAGGQVPGQPFQFLQHQIDDLKDQVAGYKVVQSPWYGGGFYGGQSYFMYALCPFGMKPVGFGGEAEAYEGGVKRDGVLLMTESKPTERTCATPEGGGNPYTLYGWEVHWYTNYQGTIYSQIRVYVICVGKEEPEPGCIMN